MRWTSPVPSSTVTNTVPDLPRGCCLATGQPATWTVSPSRAVSTAAAGNSRFHVADFHSALSSIRLFTKRSASVRLLSSAQFDHDLNDRFDELLPAFRVAAVDSRKHLTRPTASQTPLRLLDARRSAPHPCADSMRMATGRTRCSQWTHPSLPSATTVRIDVFSRCQCL